MSACRERANSRKLRRFSCIRSQRGVVLIELLVSIAIFGVVAVAFLSALVTGYHGIAFTHNKTMAESLTRTAFENVRTAPYPLSTDADNVTTFQQFDVVVHADNVTKDATEAYVVTTDYTDIQMVTVTVRNHETARSILVTKDLKVRP